MLTLVTKTIVRNKIQKQIIFVSAVDLLTARNVKTNKYLSIKVKIRRDAPQDARRVGLFQTTIGQV